MCINNLAIQIKKWCMLKNRIKNTETLQPILRFYLALSIFHALGRFVKVIFYDLHFTKGHNIWYN